MLLSSSASYKKHVT